MGADIKKGCRKGQEIKDLSFLTIGDNEPGFHRDFSDRQSIQNDLEK